MDSLARRGALGQPKRCYWSDHGLDFGAIGALLSIQALGYELLAADYDRTPSSIPMISVQPSGAIRVNKKAQEILKTLGAERVQLFWDQDRHKLAIAPATKNDKHSYNLRYDPKRASLQIATKAVIKKLGWRADHSIRIEVKLNGKMLECSVPTEHLEPSERKPKKNAGKKG